MINIKVRVYSYLKVEIDDIFFKKKFSDQLLIVFIYYFKNALLFNPWICHAKILLTKLMGIRAKETLLNESAVVDVPTTG